MVQAAERRFARVGALHQRRLAAQQRRQRARQTTGKAVAHATQQGQQLVRARPLAEQLGAMLGKGAFGNELSHRLHTGGVSVKMGGAGY